MIRYFSIKNFALIENSQLEFNEGLNIITGETGAGKSIIIQAAAILLGARASVDHIRSGMDEAVLNATIDIAKNIEIKRYLSSIGITVDEDEVLLRRVLTAGGKSRSFINGSQVASKELGVISSLLFDFHGQRDGISLLNKATHLNYLDNYLNLTADLDELNVLFQDLKKTRDDLTVLEESKIDKEKKIELLEYEIQEIEDADIKVHEDDDLRKEIKIYENIEKITSLMDEVSRSFSGEQSINSHLRLVKNNLSKLADMDGSFNDISNQISNIFYQLEDIVFEISSKKDEYVYEPGKLDGLIERSELIEKLKRKYGNSIESIHQYLDKAKQELELITFSSQKFDELSAHLATVKKAYLDKATAVSHKRKEGALILEEKVKNELRALEMSNVDFKINFELVEAADDDDICLEYEGKRIKYIYRGIDAVEFLISPNLGEPLKKLIKIASGGELSRIILALKSVLVENDTVSTMIFDEIDVGIGGKVALSVGSSLKKLANHKQIICITHLPQIAACGDRNYFINKEVVDDRTVSSFAVLDADNKIKEVARMLSGNITDVSLDHARELIETMKK